MTEACWSIHQQASMQLVVPCNLPADVYSETPDLWQNEWYGLEHLWERRILFLMDENKALMIQHSLIVITERMGKPSFCIRQVHVNITRSPYECIPVVPWIGAIANFQKSPRKIKRGLRYLEWTGSAISFTVCMVYHRVLYQVGSRGDDDTVTFRNGRTGSGMTQIYLVSRYPVTAEAYRDDLVPI